MRRPMPLAALLVLALALCLGPAGCANLSLFTSDHVHYHPDPSETGQIDALTMRVEQMEVEQAATRQGGRR